MLSVLFLLGVGNYISIWWPSWTRPLELFYFLFFQAQLRSNVYLALEGQNELKVSIKDLGNCHILLKMSSCISFITINSTLLAKLSSSKSVIPTVCNRYILDMENPVYFSYLNQLSDFIFVWFSPNRKTSTPDWMIFWGLPRVDLAPISSENFSSFSSSITHSAFLNQKLWRAGNLNSR